jgi:hypothetical protein
MLLVSDTATAQQVTRAPRSPSARTIEGNQPPPPPQKFEGKIERDAAQGTSPGSQTPASPSPSDSECRRHCNQKIDEMLASCLALLRQKRNAEAGECGQRTQNFIENCMAAQQNAKFATCPNFE